VGGAFSGAYPNTQNWTMGMTVTFPIFDIASIRARRRIENFNERAATAKYDRIVQDLNGQMEQARATLTGARRIAQITPIQLEAARTTEQQANARYKTGLGNIVEVAEAERILAQAEIDDALARLGVWRALLGVAAGAGDLQPFLNQAK
jgi:outer membrane protein TolC